MVSRTFHHVPVTREEEGVGICAGAALSGRLPAMFIQSSGIGNMINALLSLTAFYELPLALFVSRRGVYNEKIEAQMPMGQKLPAILAGAGITYSKINTQTGIRDARPGAGRNYTQRSDSCVSDESGGVGELRMRSAECGVRN